MFKKIITFLLAFCLIAMTACNNGGKVQSPQNDTTNASEKIKADKIFKNANVFTSETSNLHATAFAIKDGKFVYVGDEAGLVNYEGETVDLGGKFVMPSIFDSHIHIPVSISGDLGVQPVRIICKSKKECLDFVAKYVAENPNHNMYGFIMNKAVLSGEKLTKEDLDAICKDKPLVIQEGECHSAWVNSKIMNDAGITDETPDIAPGLSFYERDENGHKTGFMIEMTVAKALGGLSKNITNEQIKEVINKWIDYSIKHGVSAVFEAGTPGGLKFHEQVYDVLKDMDEKGELPILIDGSYAICDSAELDSAMYVLKYFREKYNTKHMHFNTLKIVSDGTMGVGTAYLLSPYEGTNNKGGHLFNEREIADIIKSLNEEGFDLHIHTVAEGAVRIALDGVELAKNELGDDYHVQVTLAHLELVHEDDIPRLKKLGVIANYTPWWHAAGGGGGGGTLKEMTELLGTERAHGMYRSKTAWNTGALVTWSSDNVSFGEFDGWSPFLGMEGGMRRIFDEHTNLCEAEKIYEKVPVEAEGMSIEEMILGYTINGAKQLKVDDRKGSIKAGKDADFIIINQNLLTAKPEGLSYIMPEEVYLEGENMFKKNLSLQNETTNVVSKGNNEYADTVVYGTIWTAEDNDTVEAFAIKDDKFIYVGDKAGATSYIKDGVTKVIDNTGKGLVIPACTEDHGHFVGIDALVRMLPGYFVKYDELLGILAETMKQDPKPEFFLSWGWDYVKFMNDFDPKKNYAQELEDIAPGIPVFMFDTGGHNAMCNVTALKKAGVYNGEKVRGGVVRTTEDGIPNGLIDDEVVFYVIERIIDFSKISPEIYLEACKNAINTLHKRGFTNYLDAYINALSEKPFYQYLCELDKRDELNINMDACFTVRSYNDKEYKEKIDYVAEMGDKYHTKHFNPYNIKLFADGVVESRTGWMIDEYPNPEKGKEHGNIVWQPEELNEIVKYANSKNILVHTHSFGDGATKAMLDAYINANNSLGKKYRNTLGHVRNITKEDIKRASENGVGIAENLIWHAMDIPNDENYEATIEMAKSNLPKGIFESGYPMKSLLDAGIVVSSSTDAPAAETLEGNIMNILSVSTTGVSPDKNNTLPFNPSELLTVREALKCLTINGAKNMGIDDKTGSIKVGKNADFVILDTNFLDYKGDDLKKIYNTKIKEVYFEGKNVLSNQ